MEPNPIYRLELRQLRRGGFLYTMAGTGVLMSAFLIVTIRYGLEFDVGSPFHMAVPTMFYVLGILGAPLVSGLRFAFQQVSEELIYETPLSGKTIVLGKFRAAVVLVLCLYLPALPGAVYQAQHGEFGHLTGMATCAALATVFSAVAVGFAAGTKTTAGALGKTVWVGVYIICGFSLFSMTVAAVGDILYKFGVEIIWLSFVMATCAIFWGTLGTVLPLWRGCLMMEKIRKPGWLIGTLLFLWIGTIAMTIGLMIFQTAFDMYADTGLLIYAIIAASVFFFSCMVGDQEKKSDSVTFY